MIQAWARSHTECRNCSTTRRPHLAHGYCGLCLRPTRAIATAQSWDPRRPETLSAVPKSGMFTADGRSLGLVSDQIDAAMFKRFRASYIAEHRRRLGSLRARERVWRGEQIESLDVERQLTRIARRLRPSSKTAFHGRATLLRKRFGSHGLVALSKLLDEIESFFPWQLDWGAIWKRTYDDD
jgi:hypothetical protein